MKKFLIYAMLPVAALLFAVASCTNENLQADGSFITLKLSSKTSARPDMAETKAETKPGEDALNENTINDVYYFFYKKDDTAGEPVIKGSIVGLDQKGTSTRTEEVPVTTGTAGTLFDGSNECQAFIVANPPKSMESTLGGTPTLEELRALTLATTLTETQESFTMVFDAVVNESAPSGNIMTVEANLQRLASKLTFAINTAKTCTDAGSTEWTSDPDNAKITFYNAFKKTNLAGDFEAVKETDSEYSKNYFNSAAITFDGKTEKSTDTWSNKAGKPVYSYPETWDFSDSKEPYVLIELPWTKSGTTTPVPNYYKVFLSAKELKMNTWCHLTVSIDQLGSLTPDDPTQLFENMKYLVLDWNDAFEGGEGITADVEDTRYLMLNQKKFEIFNLSEWDIPFTSSHECEITNIHYSVNSYESAEPDNINDVDDGWEWLNARKGVSVTIDGALAVFKHKLTNNLDSLGTDNKGVKHGLYDISQYTFTFDIRHKDKPDKYVETVTIVQYPAIYIVPNMNSIGDIPTPNNSNRPTAFLNVNTPAKYNSYGTLTDVCYGGDPYDEFYGTVGNIGQTNGNMYVITTSTAPDLKVNDDGVMKQYMLADPRQANPRIPIATDRETGVNTVYKSADAVGESTQRRITYYYPTKGDANSVNLIAPKIRVASSWGQTYDIQWAEAETRCAAYQEDGYPAGRWRLPTAAELMYICKLSSDHVIPMLYGSKSYETTDYWCSSGYVTVYQAEDSDGLLNAQAPVYHPIYGTNGEAADKTQQTSTKPVRCVYDEWYWENRDVSGPNPTTGGRVSNYSQRIWGDMMR